MEFQFNCVAPRDKEDEQILELCNDIGEEISCEEFLNLVDIDINWFNTQFRYNDTLPMCKDWHIRFYKFKYKNKLILCLQHSAIEYIFY
jgi:hypothetical protein